MWRLLPPREQSPPSRTTTWLLGTTTRSAAGDSCFLAREQSWRTALRARSLLSRTTPDSGTTIIGPRAAAIAMRDRAHSPDGGRGLSRVPRCDSELGPNGSSCARAPRCLCTGCNASSGVALLLVVYSTHAVGGRWFLLAQAKQVPRPPVCAQMRKASRVGTCSP